MAADLASLTTITIGDRDREDLGDIEALAESIRAVGLLHPVVVTESRVLIAGGRRLAAVERLGWAEVPITIVSVDTAAQVLRAEADENTERKGLTPYEASRARERRARVLAEDATKRQAHGQTAPGRSNASAKLAEASPAASRETRKVAANGTGYSGSTLDKVDNVRQIAERGVVTVGRGKTREEVPAPAPVREAAERRLVELKRPNAAIDPAEREVRELVERHVESDPDVLNAKFMKRFVYALSGVLTVYADFDSQRVADLADEITAEQLERHATGLWEFAERIRRARTGLRLVEGGRA